MWWLRETYYKSFNIKNYINFTQQKILKCDLFIYLLESKLVSKENLDFDIISTGSEKIDHNKTTSRKRGSNFSVTNFSFCCNEQKSTLFRNMFFTIKFLIIDFSAAIQVNL